MSDNVFRAQLSAWRSSANVISRNATPENESFLSRLNPFGDRGLRLPFTEREDTIEEPGWFTLSRWDRLIVFGVCLLAAALMFALCFALLPIMAVKPRKFATLWTLGSVFFILSFAVLQGPVSFFVHVTSSNRILFSLAYFGSIILTLVFSLGMHSAILTIPAVIVQILAALWYTISYFPMGTQSLKFASRLGAQQVTGWINS